MSAPLRRAVVFLLAVLTVPQMQGAAQQPRGAATLRDFDVRDGRPPVPPRLGTAIPQARVGLERASRTRFNDDTGSVRVLDGAGLPPTFASSPVELAAYLARNAAQLGLDPSDLGTLRLIRDYASRSTGIRHVLFEQVVDGYPVFESVVAVHLKGNGSMVRIASNASPTAGRVDAATVSAAQARSQALAHAVGTTVAGSNLVWLPIDGRLRLAWHTAVTGAAGGDAYDVLIDAQTTALLIRRNRLRAAEGSGRVFQSPSPSDPRRPDAMPLGAAGACPPPVNHIVRSLDAPFRDRASVLASTGRLDGNNVRVQRATAGGQSATGVFDGASWLFDFPFNSAGATETSLFFAVNFVHDFFYDLGFDEAAGNFQVNNFARGGAAGDPLRINARAPGRNNANYVHAADGTSPTINMFLWDGNGCWSDDVDNNGVADLDGGYDTDIVVHEYHHGVSLRLNTAFTGNEAGAIGEGGGDFFAYSVNGDSTLAEYARPGGLRSVNGKSYADWTCLVGVFCEVHDNGEIWANVLWDVRERFRADAVGGGEAASINEVHQLYVDGLKLSPPAPTMLDMRDAMLVADELSNPAGSSSLNFCRIWESFAGRGMGVSATDTSDNGFNRVSAGYDVPDGCTPPPAPPVVTVSVAAATALEAGAVPAAVTFSRGVALDRATSVNYVPGGTAAAGTDYVPLSRVATIPAGSVDVTVPVVPIDDTLVEGNESVTIALAPGSGYTPGTPSSASISIVSDDVTADLTVASLSAPRSAGAGGLILVTDSIRNQGTGPAPASETTLHLSKNGVLDGSDVLLGRRSVASLAPGATDTGTTTVVLPQPLDAGSYYVIAKADGANATSESSEFNNTRTAGIAIGPDLVVMTLTVPATAAAGDTIAVSDTTANQGAGAASASTTRFHLSSDITLDAADRPLQARGVAGLDPGASATATTSLTLPPDLVTGTYYLIAQADAAGAVGEATETNNTRWATVRVGPDLTIFNLVAPSRAAPGASIAVTDTIRNNGAGTAGPSSTAFFLSSNLTLDGSDVRLEPSRQVSALPAGQSTAGTVTVTLPPVAPGTWYLFASADDGRQVAETNEGNNTRFASVLVGPDLTVQAVSVPTTAIAGSSVNVSSTIRNGGAVQAGASLVRFYLSVNTALDANDIAIDASRAVPALAPDTTNSGAVAVPLPPGVSGNFYLLVVADGGQAVVEANEQNNVAARALVIGGAQ